MTGAFDQDNQMMPPYDWKEPCLELGAFKSDRTPYPIAKALARFMSFVRSLPFPALPAAKTDCVIVVRDDEMVNSTYVLARQAGLQPRFADPTKRLPAAPVYFLPDARGRACLSLRHWEELKARVRDGGEQQDRRIRFRRLEILCAGLPETAARGGSRA